MKPNNGEGFSNVVWIGTLKLTIKPLNRCTMCTNHFAENQMSI